MNMTEFYDILQYTPRLWTIDPHGCIRTGAHCPVTRVATMLGYEHITQDRHIFLAGTLIGLAHENVLLALYAADDLLEQAEVLTDAEQEMSGDIRHTRDKLLEACGLPEEAH